MNHIPTLTAFEPYWHATLDKVVHAARWTPGTAIDGVFGEIGELPKVADRRLKAHLDRKSTPDAMGRIDRAALKHPPTRPHVFLESGRKVEINDGDWVVKHDLTRPFCVALADDEFHAAHHKMPRGLPRSKGGA